MSNPSGLTAPYGAPTIRSITSLDSGLVPKTQRGSSEPPSSARSPQGEISSESPLVPSNTSHVEPSKAKERPAGLSGETEINQKSHQPFTDRSVDSGEKELLLDVARAADSGKSAPFVTVSKEDRTVGNWRSGESSFTV